MGPSGPLVSYKTDDVRRGATEFIGESVSSQLIPVLLLDCSVHYLPDLEHALLHV